MRFFIPAAYPGLVRGSESSPEELEPVVLRDGSDGKEYSGE